MLALPPAPGWEIRAEADRTGRTPLYDHAGVERPYAELCDEAGDRYLSELEPELWDKKYQRCLDAVTRLSDDIIGLDPDLLVIVGDDQDELFALNNNPSIAISYADVVATAGPSDDDPPEMKLFRERLGMDGASYPGDPDAALHLIEHLMASSFDLAAVCGPGERTGFGHAFAWVLGRLLRETSIPCVPVLLNTYYPPNQPRPQRCLELGHVLREACDSLPGDRRIVVVASGGLSHFVVDAGLDETVLSAIRDHDEDTLASLPTALLNSGTSEIRNWIAMSGASEGLDWRWTEYEAAYRTPAGSGCGLGFTLLTG